jgi:AraC-like DNA-binding protein
MSSRAGLFTTDLAIRAALQNRMIWWWANASDNNTIDIANLPPGEHKVQIQLVDADHNVFPGQSKIVTIEAIRIDEARRRLEESTDRIETIAAHTGFTGDGRQGR